MRYRLKLHEWKSILMMIKLAFLFGFMEVIKIIMVKKGLTNWLIFKIFIYYF